MSLTGLFNAGRIPAQRMINHPEVYALIHFSMNTFTGKEWGYGDETPSTFNPAEFDADRIVQACKDGGMEGIILVCKHHDGFCLWPTKTTDHNISKSSWRNGKGDVVREFTDACRRAGLKMGFYVSPWDRNHPAYGTAEYLNVYQEQLREIYSSYGEAFEAWFDGANGGDGYYGGECGVRKIDHTTYYDWKNTWQIIRELQPGAAMFSDVGPDLRWVGNEKGFADPDCFASFTPVSPDEIKDAAPGFCNCENSDKGEAEGQFYLPAECDVPLRPGWFFHARENEQLKSVSCLLRIYLRSVGAGCYLNLGISPDNRGLLHDNDVKRLKEFHAAVQALFSRKQSDGVCVAESGKTTVIKLNRAVSVNLFDFAEDLSQGERIREYRIEFLKDGKSVSALKGHAVGRRRIRPFETVKADAVSIEIKSSDSRSVSLKYVLYHAPEELLKEEREARSVMDRPDYRKLENGVNKDLAITGDLGSARRVKGFIFTPNPDLPGGTPSHWTFEVRKPGSADWTIVAEDEFSNLKANPIPQVEEFPEISADAVRFRVRKMLIEGTWVNCREFGILYADL